MVENLKSYSSLYNKKRYLSSKLSSLFILPEVKFKTELRKKKIKNYLIITTKNSLITRHKVSTYKIKMSTLKP